MSFDVFGIGRVTTIAMIVAMVAGWYASTLAVTYRMGANHVRASQLTEQTDAIKTGRTTRAEVRKPASGGGAGGAVAGGLHRLPDPYRRAD